MEQLIWETAEELDQKLAQRIKNIRKRRSISQEKLSSMSGVSYGSIKDLKLRSDFLSPDNDAMRWYCR